jgi:molybdopterin synthase sulfur carrier subunit
MTKGDTTQTIQISVKVFGGLRESFRGGTQHLQVAPTSTLAVLLQDLKTDFPDLSEKLATGLEAGYLNVLINGRNIRFLQGHDTPLQNGDTVAFLPPVGGG